MSIYENIQIEKGLNMGSLKLNYSLKIFQNSTDDKFLDALDVYISTVPRNEKTNTNEIIWCLDNAKQFKKFELYFLGLELNNKIIGYAEIAFLRRTRYVTLDYLAIDKKYRTHSAFYTFLLLIVEYFANIKLDYDFIGIELLTNDDSFTFQKNLSEFEIEGFRVVNTTYIQPCLEPNNYDSQHDAILLIYQRNTTNKRISQKTYLDIVHSIYFDYYFEWDSHFLKNNEENSKNYNKLKQTYETIESTLTDEVILLNGYPFSKMSSEDKIIPNEKKINKKLWQALFFTMIFGVFSLGIIFTLNELNVELAIAGVIFVLLLFTWLSFLAFTENRAYIILTKIPGLSKLFENIK